MRAAKTLPSQFLSAIKSRSRFGSSPNQDFQLLRRSGLLSSREAAP